MYGVIVLPKVIDSYFNRIRSTSKSKLMTHLLVGYRFPDIGSMQRFQTEQANVPLEGYVDLLAGEISVAMG